MSALRGKSGSGADLLPCRSLTLNRHERPNFTNIAAAMEKRIQGQLRDGKGMLAIAKALGCGTSTVQRVAREMQAGRPFDGASAAA
jgi:hypothetical protein